MSKRSQKIRALSLKQTLLGVALTYIAINATLIVLHVVSSWQQATHGFETLAEAYLDSSFEMYKSEMIGNILLDDRDLLSAFMNEMIRNRRVSASLTGKYKGFFGPPSGTGAYSKAFPLGYGDDTIGTLTLYYRVPETTLGFYAGTITTMVIQILLSLVGILVVYALMNRRVLNPIQRLKDATTSSDQVSIILPDAASREIHALAHAFQAMRARLIESARFEAIARTSQMLAHDVRTPFSMLASLLSAIRSSKNPETIVQMAHHYSPHVDRAMSSVESMINDIVAIGSRSKPVLEPVQAEKILQLALSSVFCSSEANFRITYDFRHKHRIMADEQSLNRVFSNIIRNAAEAVHGSATLWIKTRDEVLSSGKRNGNRAFIRIVIGNSDTFIERERLDHIFEAFFTAGKKNGTGLGLAIARQIVNAHGGEIWCESTKDFGTEFHIRIPLADGEEYAPQCDLPESSQLFRLGTIPPSASPLKSIAQPVFLGEQGNAQRKILLIDDEPLYLETLGALISNTSGESCHIMLCSNASQVEGLVQEQKPDLIVIDIDLGKDAPDGFHLTRTLREAGCTARICVHSNRGGKSLEAEARAAGADLVIQKPMTAEHLKDLLANESTTRLRPQMILIDDNAFVRAMWEETPESFAIKTFESPEEFLAALAAQSQLLSQTSGLIFDFFFEGSSLDGLDLATKMRACGYQGAIFISTDATVPEEDLKAAQVTQVSKVPERALDEINQVLDRTGRQGQR